MSAVDAAKVAIARGFVMAYTVGADKKANGPDACNARTVLTGNTGVSGEAALTDSTTNLIAAQPHTGSAPLFVPGHWGRGHDL